MLEASSTTDAAADALASLSLEPPTAERVAVHCQPALGALVDDDVERPMLETLELVRTSTAPERYEWRLLRDVPAGAVLYIEAPAGYVASLDCDDALLRSPALRAMYPGVRGADGTSNPVPPAAKDAPSSADSDKSGDDRGAASIVSVQTLCERYALPPLTARDALVWVLVCSLFAHEDDDGTRDALLQSLPVAGAASRAAEYQRAFASLDAAADAARTARAALLPDDMDATARAALEAAADDAKTRYGTLLRTQREAAAWIAAIQRLAGGRGLAAADVLHAYAVVARNALALTTPLTGARYGLALFAGAAHMPHSCVPPVRTTFTTGGRLVLEAARALTAGTRIEINRVRMTEPWFRCLATAPAHVQRGALGLLGGRCACAECTAAAAAEPPLNVAALWIVRTPHHDVASLLATVARTAAAAADELRTYLACPVVLSLVTRPAALFAGNTAAVAAAHRVFANAAETHEALALARLVVATEATRLTRVYGACDDALVDAAARYMHEHALSLLERRLVEQRADATVRARARCTLAAELAFVRLSLRCVRHVAASGGDRRLLRARLRAERAADAADVVSMAPVMRAALDVLAADTPALAPNTYTESMLESALRHVEDEYARGRAVPGDVPSPDPWLTCGAPRYAFASHVPYIIKAAGELDGGSEEKKK